MTTASPLNSSKIGFTLLEVVIVIAVVGIMSAMAISAFSNGAGDAREIVARQQQATLQSAVNAWVVGQFTGDATVAEVRTVYNAATTSEAKLALIQEYLDDTSFDHFNSESASDASTKVISGSVRKLNWHFDLPDWTDGSYPKVDLVRSSP